MGTPYEKTVDGLELQFASNHISNFLFTNLIMPKLIESLAPRVVSVSSVGHFWGPVRFNVCMDLIEAL
jgi:NAD(P)-dependent dehydrogenase (short-subunit alcohol dehydrogenase family)